MCVVTRLWQLSPLIFFLSSSNIFTVDIFCMVFLFFSFFFLDRRSHFQLLTWQWITTTERKRIRILKVPYSNTRVRRKSRLPSHGSIWINDVKQSVRVNLSIGKTGYPDLRPLVSNLTDVTRKRFTGKHTPITGVRELIPKRDVRHRFTFFVLFLFDVILPGITGGPYPHPIWESESVKGRRFQSISYYDMESRPPDVEYPKTGTRPNAKLSVRQYFNFRRTQKTHLYDEWRSRSTDLVSDGVLLTSLYP